MFGGVFAILIASPAQEKVRDQIAAVLKAEFRTSEQAK
jgi:hypothetical protein